MNSTTGGLHYRRQRALHYLVDQLEVKGTKPQRINGRTVKATEPLTDSDRKRIEKEVKVLEERTYG